VPGDASVRFDRAATYYDTTRRVDPDALEATVALLRREVAGRGRVLEMGVGTGQLALPLHAAGVPVVGADISRPMMAVLAEKASAAAPFPLVEADATAAPFADGAFGGAFVRWLLHLIPAWEVAVAELCRVVRPGGTILVDPGGYAGRWRDVWLRFLQEVGPQAHAVGLDMRLGFGVLDEAFAAHGATARDLPSIRYARGVSLDRLLQEAAERKYTWTWRVSSERLGPALQRVRAWAATEFGDEALATEANVDSRWRAYDLPA
jgi:SAM-dependent methyltransferase